MTRNPYWSEILKEIILLSRSVTQARIIMGSHVVCIPRIIINADADAKTIPIQIRQRQCPSRPAFTMNINKSQGQTFQKIAIYLPAPVSAHRQLYVALSRVENPRVITVLIAHPPLPDQPPGLPLTRNVVYTNLPAGQRSSTRTTTAPPSPTATHVGNFEHGHYLVDSILAM